MSDSTLFSIRCLSDQTQADLEHVRANVTEPNAEPIRPLIAALKELAKQLDDTNAKLSIHLANHSR